MVSGVESHLPFLWHGQQVGQEEQDGGEVRPQAGQVAEERAEGEGEALPGALRGVGEGERGGAGEGGREGQREGRKDRGGRSGWGWRVKGKVHGRGGGGGIRGRQQATFICLFVH